MNTTTLQESAAIAEAVATVSAGPEFLLIPLSRLCPSARNVRKSGGTSIPVLAVSIARVGLLQNLNVVLSADGQYYEVVAGRRRLAALKLLVKRRKLPKDHEVPCMVVADAAARTVSLTENVQREAMHPADQFEAFAALKAEGRAVEDIAADFGVTPLVVTRRLKLANVSPRLLADYRSDAVTLDQLMALAITDDHAKQEAAFYEASQWQRDPQSIRRYLTREEIDAAGDGVALFVGVDAYVQAGGGVRRDLFADEDGGVFLADAALLDTLARDKMAKAAAGVSAEGWAWVEVVPRATYAEIHAFHRVHPTRREPTKAEARQVSKLEAEFAKLQQRMDDDDDAPGDDEAQALQDAMDTIIGELDALERGLQVFSSDMTGRAGAVLSVDRTGSVVVHRGLLREAETKAPRGMPLGSDSDAGSDAGTDSEVGAVEPTCKPISERLARQLSAHRTAALQAEVARHPHIALVALVHRLAERVVLNVHNFSPLGIRIDPQDRLDQLAPDLGDSPAAKGMRDVLSAWAERLPKESDALFAELLLLPQSELLSLLALCVGVSVSAITGQESDQPAASLAQAVGLDMGRWWTPSASGYFAHVTKTKVLEAVQVFAPGEVDRLSKLKKDQIASEAERLAAGSGWLPAMFLEAGWMRNDTRDPESAGGAQLEEVSED